MSMQAKVLLHDDTIDPCPCYTCLSNLLNAVIARNDELVKLQTKNLADLVKSELECMELRDACEELKLKVAYLGKRINDLERMQYNAK